MAATYARFQGSAQCGVGAAGDYARISSVDDCTLAGRSVGLLQSNQQATLGSYTQSAPGGCFVIGGVSVSFNANAASSGAGDVLCRLASAASPPPPPDVAAPASSDDGGFPVALVVTICAVVLLLALACAWANRERLCRRRPPPPPPRRYPVPPPPRPLVYAPVVAPPRR